MIVEKRGKMADFGVLSALRQILIEDESIKKLEFGGNIYLAIPPQANLPLVVLELEEVWTSMRLDQHHANARLKLKASIFSNVPTGRESLNMAEAVREAVDGKTINLKEGKKGIVRLSGSMMDIAAANKPRNINQYYEVLIRG